MATNRKRPDSNYTAFIATGTVTAGTPVIENETFYMPLTSGTSGDRIAAQTEGVWTLVKETPLVIAQGDAVYWDVGNTRVDKTTTNLLLGTCSVAAASGATSVEVALKGGVVRDSADIDFGDLAAGTVDPAADSYAFLDATDGITKTDAIADIAGLQAGNGLTAAAGVTAVLVDPTAGLGGLASAAAGVSLDINDLDVVAVNVADDSLAFDDATGSTPGKTTIALLATAQAGNGIAATNGVNAVEVNATAGLGGIAVAAAGVSLDINDLDVVAVDVANDSLAFDDDTGNTPSRTTIAALATAQAGNGLVAAAGVNAVLVDPTAGLGGIAVAAAGVSLDVNDLDVVAVDVAADSLPFNDATGNTPGRTTIALLATDMAGYNMKAAAGIISTKDLTVTADGAVGPQVISAAEILGGIFSVAPTGADNETTDTAANIVAAGTPEVADWHMFTLINLSGANVATLLGGAGVTLVGAAAVAINTSATWLMRYDNVTGAAEAVTFYRITA